MFADVDRLEQPHNVLDSKEFTQLQLEYQQYKRGNNTKAVEFPQELASENCSKLEVLSQPQINLNSTHKLGVT